MNKKVDSVELSYFSEIYITIGWCIYTTRNPQTQISMIQLPHSKHEIGDIMPSWCYLLLPPCSYEESSNLQYVLYLIVFSISYQTG